MPTTGPDAGCVDAACRWRGETLDCANLILRRPAEDDVQTLVDLAGEWEVARHTAFIPYPYGEEDARTFIAEAPGEAADGAHVVFAVERRTEPGLVGCAGLIISGNEAEIGYWIGQPFWGHGFASEAVRRLMRLAFAVLGLGRVHAEILADNPASMRVLDKAGFTRVGETICGRGRCQDQFVIAYEIARSDWLARQAAAPQVLVVAAALVDADGRVLLARRPAGKSMAGLWEFPGGKVGAGETPEAALVRELAEELTIDVTESCLAPIAFASYPYDDFHLLMPLYVCRVWRGSPVPTEGQLLKWVWPTAMAAMPMPPADVPLVATLRDLL